MEIEIKRSSSSAASSASSIDDHCNSDPSPSPKLFLKSIDKSTNDNALKIDSNGKKLAIAQNRRPATTFFVEDILKSDEKCCLQLEKCVAADTVVEDSLMKMQRLFDDQLNRKLFMHKKFAMAGTRTMSAEFLYFIIGNF